MKSKTLTGNAGASKRMIAIVKVANPNQEIGMMNHAVNAMRSKVTGIFNKRLIASGLIKLLALGCLIILLFPIHVREGSNINYSNFQFARDIHQEWVATGGSIQWNTDWVIAYQAFLDEQDGKVIEYDIPDIKSKWLNWKYNRR